MVGDLATMVEHSMVDALAAPSNGDWSWVETGVAAWSWVTNGTSRQDDPELIKAYIDLAAELGLPVNIHPMTNQDVAKVAELFPKLNVIMAHPGDKASYLEKLDLMKSRPNVHLDLCGTGLFRWGMLKHGVKTLGAERFLFGSDFPVCNAAMNRAAVLSENLKADELELIFSGNFRRLANL